MPGLFDYNEPKEASRWPGFPLTHFRAKLKSIEAITKFDRVHWQGNFTDLVVLAAEEPYGFPTVQLEIPYSFNERTGSTTPNTQYSALTASFRKVIPADAFAAGVEDAIVGKMQEWKYTDAPLRAPEFDEDNNPVMEIATWGKNKGQEQQKWTVQTRRAWQLQAVDGYARVVEVGSRTLTDEIIDGAVGKTDLEVAQWYIGNTELKKYSDYGQVSESVVDRKMLPTLVAAGKLVKAGDVYAKP